MSSSTIHHEDKPRSPSAVAVWIENLRENYKELMIPPPPLLPFSNFQIQISPVPPLPAPRSSHDTKTLDQMAQVTTRNFGNKDVVNINDAATACVHAESLSSMGLSEQICTTIDEILNDTISFAEPSNGIDHVSDTDSCRSLSSFDDELDSAPAIDNTIQELEAMSDAEFEALIEGVETPQWVSESEAIQKCVPPPMEITTQSSIETNTDLAVMQRSRLDCDQFLMTNLTTSGDQAASEDHEHRSSTSDTSAIDDVPRNSISSTVAQSQTKKLSKPRKVVKPTSNNDEISLKSALAMGKQQQDQGKNKTKSGVAKGKKRKASNAEVDDEEKSDQKTPPPKQQRKTLPSTRKPRRQTITPKAHLVDQTEDFTKILEMIRTATADADAVISGINQNTTKLLEENHKASSIVIKLKEQLAGMQKKIIEWGAREDLVTQQWSSS